MKALSFSNIILQKQLLNSLMAKGKKQTAYRLFSKILWNLSQKQISPYNSVLTASQKLCPIVESRNINKKRRAAFMIPFPKRFRNPEARGLKILSNYIRTTKIPGTLEKQFSSELTLTLTGKSNVYEMARQNHRQATAVKYLRYRRWF